MTSNPYWAIPKVSPFTAASASERTPLLNTGRQSFQHPKEGPDQRYVRKQINRHRKNPQPATGEGQGQIRTLPRGR